MIQLSLFCFSTSASESWHIHPSTSVWHVLPDFLTCLYAALFPQFAWHTMSNCQNLMYMQYVWVETYVVECIDWPGMKAFIHLDLRSPVTAPSMTRIRSLSKILLVNLASNFGYTFSHNHNQQECIMFVGNLSTWFGVYNFRMFCMTLIHALTNYYMLQFGHWNPKNADR